MHGLRRDDTGSAHHVENPRSKTKQKKNDHSPGRDTKPAVEEPAYGAAKAGTDKMVHDMAIDLKDTDLSIISYWPGYVRTDESKAIPDEYFPAEMQAILPEFETPEFSGLVLAALLEDPRRKALSGRALIGAELARDYGIKDLDGKQPRDWTETMGRPQRFFVAGKQERAA